MIVELSSGHVFEASSVRSISPIYSPRGPNDGVPDAIHIGRGFDVHGVGYKVTITLLYEVYRHEFGSEIHNDRTGGWYHLYEAVIQHDIEALRKEAIVKLLMNGHS